MLKDALFNVHADMIFMNIQVSSDWNIVMSHA